MPQVLPAHVDEDDVEQEYQYRRWQGLPASKKVIRQRLCAEAGPLDSLEDLALQGVDFATGEDSLGPPEGVNLDAIDALVDWALRQVGGVQQVIWEFLSNPEEKYNQTVKALGLGKEKPSPGPTPSVTQVVLRALPANYDQLLELVSRTSHSKRPAAQLRQCLRRLVATGSITQHEGCYVCSDANTHPDRDRRPGGGGEVHDRL